MCYPDSEKIKSYLQTQVLGHKIVCVQETESTNTLAKELARDGEPHGTLVICRRQTHGRGKMGRKWESDSDGSLCMSIILRPDISAELTSRYIPAAAIAVVKALERVNVKSSIKWPNDILANGKKICGILTESGFYGEKCAYVVCGIGINVNNRYECSSDEYLTVEAPAEIKNVASVATSVCDIIGHDTEREKIAAFVLNELEKTISLCADDIGYNALLKEYARASCVLGKEVIVIDGNKRIRGKAVGLDAIGRIIVLVQGREECFNAGDVSLRM